jgi:type IV pilus assembly protein PilW
MRREAGFSIIELMISITLGLVILAALTTFFVQTSQNRREMDRNTRQIENGRYAIDTLRDDVTLAGFYADMVPLAVPAWSPNAPCPTNAADPTALGFLATPTYTAPLPLTGFADGAGAPTACLPNLVPNTDVLVVHRFNSELLTLAQAQAGTPADYPNKDQWYAQISECVDDPPTKPFVIDVGSGANFTLRKHNCTDTADLWRLRQSVYYIRDYSVTPGDGLPTLVRKELRIASGVVMQEVPLVEGITSMRVDYGIDNDGDGHPDAWSRCDAVTPCTPTQWGNVMAAKIYVLSRNIDPSNGYTDSKTYYMGLAGSTAATNDQYKRHVYSAQVNLPNRSGPREPQLVSAP